MTAMYVTLEGGSVEQEYVKVMGRAPRNFEAGTIAFAQWTYPKGAGKTRAEQKARALALAETRR